MADEMSSHSHHHGQHQGGYNQGQDSYNQGGSNQDQDNYAQGGYSQNQGPAQGGIQWQDNPTQRMSPGDLHQAGQTWAQQASPQHVQDTTTQAVQPPPEHQAGFIEHITDWFHQHGIKPADAGVPTNDPKQMTPQDAGQLAGYAHEQNPDVIKGLFSPEIGRASCRERV